MCNWKIIEINLHKKHKSSTKVRRKEKIKFPVFYVSIGMYWTSILHIYVDVFKIQQKKRSNDNTYNIFIINFKVFNKA